MATCVVTALIAGGTGFSVQTCALQPKKRRNRNRKTGGTGTGRMIVLVLLVLLLTQVTGCTGGNVAWHLKHPIVLMRRHICDRRSHCLAIGACVCAGGSFAAARVQLGRTCSSLCSSEEVAAAT